MQTLWDALPTLGPWTKALLIIALAWTAIFFVRRRLNARNISPMASSMVSRDELSVRDEGALSELPKWREALERLTKQANPSAIDVVNQLISTGLTFGASDIHMSPASEGTRVRLRIHGLLYDLGVIPQKLHPFVVSRIKVVSDLPIFKKNTPQDGRIRIEDDRYTARVSILPTNHGEKVVLRLASRRGGLYDLSRLGMTPDMLALYQAVLNRNQGVIVMTGPTGSGKTTTMYASMQYIDATRGRAVNIVTLEDPTDSPCKAPIAQHQPTVTAKTAHFTPQHRQRSAVS